MMFGTNVHHQGTAAILKYYLTALVIERKFSTEFLYKCPYTLDTKNIIKEKLKFKNSVYLWFTENTVWFHVCEPLHSCSLCPKHPSLLLPHFRLLKPSSPFKTCSTALSATKPSVASLPLLVNHSLCALSAPRTYFSEAEFESYLCRKCWQVNIF